MKFSKELHLVLIPKNSGAKDIKDFRSISFVGVSISF